MFALRTTQTVIKLDRVHRSYGQGSGRCVALQDITLQILKGSFTALAGPSGSGKTTLLNIVGAIDRPSSGVVKIGDCNLAGMKEKEISTLRLRQIGFVFQSFNLVPVLSVAENVEFPLLFRHDLTANERKKRTEWVVDMVGLGSKKGRRPHELSGGEQQRTALARALAGQPAIVLADEPTANLDQETAAAVIQLMRSINRQQGTTFFYATHDAQLINLAENIVKLRNGCLAAEAAA
jgi:putative ABC transport system ATP-binding protein